jgi:DNA-binding NarL/FixJ family response regulator
MQNREPGLRETRELLLCGGAHSASESGSNSGQRRQKPPVRVLIAVPDVMTGEYITETLKPRTSYFNLKVMIGNASTVLQEVTKLTPDVTLLSDELEDGPQAGFKVLRELRRSNTNTAVVMLLRRSNSDALISTFRLGARGVVYRSHSFKFLPKCLQTVHEGQIWVGNEDLELILDWLSRVNSVTIAAADGSSLLSNREQDVVRLVADGMKNREIAQALSLTEHSVRNYLYRIFDKVGVSSRAELILYALSHRGIEVSPRTLGRGAEVVPAHSENAS